MKGRGAAGRICARPASLSAAKHISASRDQADRQAWCRPAPRRLAGAAQTERDHDVLASSGESVA